MLNTLDTTLARIKLPMIEPSMVICRGTVVVAGPVAYAPASRTAHLINEHKRTYPLDRVVPVDICEA